jgi:FMN phosphatase YigB (HAD superfamily)
MKIRAVFFDAGETLIYRNPSLLSIASRYIKKAGLRVNKGKLAKVLNAAALEMRPIVERGKMADSAKWVVYIGKVFGKLKIRDKALADSLRMRLKDGTSFRPFSDAAYVADYLHTHGIITGIISNASATLDKILKRIGLADKFRHIVISETAGSEKPHKKIFQEALKMAGTRAAETVYVGDNYIADIYGAGNAGLIPVWIKRGGKNAEFSFSGEDNGKTRKIRNLKELLTIMKREAWL